MGVTQKLVFESSSTSINGMELSGGETTRVQLTLPVDVKIAASFTPESFGKKLAKLFKKELQTGDKPFDDAIFISTDTPDTTAKLLADAAVRELVQLYVTTGGPLQIHGATMEVVLMGRQDQEDPNVVKLVQAVLLAASLP
jgi:hypothetical protein